MAIYVFCTGQTYESSNSQVNSIIGLKRSIRYNYSFPSSCFIKIR